MKTKPIVVTAPIMFIQDGAKEVGDQLCAALRSHAVVIADLSDTSTCDLAAIGEVCVAHDLARRSNRELRLVVTSAAIMKQFALAGLDGELLFYPSLSLASKPGRATAAGRLKWSRELPRREASPSGQSESTGAHRPSQPSGHHDLMEQPARRRDLLVVVLAVTTGAVDGVSFLRLGHVFSSVITGNLVLLGVAAGRRYPALALSGGVALAGYAIGVLVGAWLARTKRDDQPIWPVAVTRALSAEFLLLAAFSAVWYAYTGHPGTAARLGLLMTAAAAMGVQSAAVRRLGPMSSTYLTSTLAGLLTALAVRRKPADWQRASGVLGAIVTGAALGALSATLSPFWVPAAILLPLSAVLLTSRTGDWKAAAE